MRVTQELLLESLVNQDDHAAPIRSPVRGRTSFSKSRGLWASVPYFPLPTPILPPFSSRPIFRASRVRAGRI